MVFNKYLTLTSSSNLFFNYSIYLYAAYNSSSTLAFSYLSIFKAAFKTLIFFFSKAILFYEGEVSGV